MHRNSLTFRFVAITALSTVVILLVGGVALVLMFQQSMSKVFNARLENEMDRLVAAMSEAADLRTAENLQVSGGVSSGVYWQIMVRDDSSDPFAQAQILRKSQSLYGGAKLPVYWLPGDGDLRYADGVLGEEEEQAAAPAEGVQEEDRKPEIRMLYRGVHLTRPYTLVVALDRETIMQEHANFKRAVFGAMGLMALGLLVMVMLLLRVGLRPLGDVRKALSDIRSGRARRIDAEFPAEIAPVAEDLNGLLDHNEEVMQRARTQVGNLAHALKTPLSVLANEARLRPGPLADVVSNQTEVMRQQVERYLARARTAAAGLVLGARTEVQPVVGTIGRTLGRVAHTRNVMLDIHIDPGLAFRGERQDLEEMVGNLMDNAFKWASEQVRVSGVGNGSSLSLAVEDDGPGLPEDQWEAVLQRGARLDETVPGSGLGLSIVFDLARAYRGSLALGRGSLGGLRVELTLPRAPRV